MLIGAINGLKKMGKRNERTLPGISMWTCIAIRLTHLIFQYSGEPDACLLNTAQQNAHCLRNFDINGQSPVFWLFFHSLTLFSEFRGVFSDTATTLYKKTISVLQEKLKPIIVSAMLDHDSLHGTSSGKSIEVSSLLTQSTRNTTNLFGLQRVIFNGSFINWKWCIEQNCVSFLKRDISFLARFSDKIVISFEVANQAKWNTGNSALLIYTHC